MLFCTFAEKYVVHRFHTQMRLKQFCAILNTSKLFCIEKKSNQIEHFRWPTLIHAYTANTKPDFLCKFVFLCISLELGVYVSIPEASTSHGIRYKQQLQQILQICCVEVKTFVRRQFIGGNVAGRWSTVSSLCKIKRKKYC